MAAPRGLQLNERWSICRKAVLEPPRCLFYFGGVDSCDVVFGSKIGTFGEVSERIFGRFALRISTAEGGSSRRGGNATSFPRSDWHKSMGREVVLGFRCVSFWHGVAVCDLASNTSRKGINSRRVRLQSVLIASGNKLLHSDFCSIR